MRLIDADALMKVLGVQEECEDCKHERRGHFCSKSHDFIAACEAITYAPTIMDEIISSDGTLTVTVPKGTHVGRVLVQEDGTQYGGLYYPDEDRKRGKWIVYKAPDKYHCGLVKCPFCGEDMIAEADEYNFCPNCGAQMGGSDG